MQLRKMLRILNEIKDKYGDRIQVSVQTNDFKNSGYDYHEISEVGISRCFYADGDGFTGGCPDRAVVSVGLEHPNCEIYK